MTTSLEIGEFEVADPGHVPRSSTEIEPPVGYKRLTGRKGSHPGGICTDGERTFYWKVPPGPDHARSEVLAANLYRLASVDTPMMKLAQSRSGELGILSPMVEDKQPHVSRLLAHEPFLRTLRRGFAVDAWLANWDVLGLSGQLRNILVRADGTPVRVDMGGALMFRALGQYKGAAFNGSALEWVTMRDPSISRASGRLFGRMSRAELIESAALVRNVGLGELREAVDASGYYPGQRAILLRILVERRDSILSQAKRIPARSPSANKAPWRRTQPTQFAERSRPLQVPYVDCWRLSIECDGSLFSPERGEPVHVGTSAVCRYNPSHRPPVQGCECGYYAVADGSFGAIDCFFGSETLKKFTTNGVVLYWAQGQRNKFPVLTKIRLHEPWIDSLQADGSVFRGNRFDVIGPAYAVDEGSAARLAWLPVPVQTVADLRTVHPECWPRRST